MDAREKAKQLFDKFSKFTNGYVGSSMLSNLEFEDVKKDRTKEIVSSFIDEIEKVGCWIDENCATNHDWDLSCTEEFWQEVREELKKI